MADDESLRAMPPVANTPNPQEEGVIQKRVEGLDSTQPGFDAISSRLAQEEPRIDDDTAVTGVVPVVADGGGYEGKDVAKDADDAATSGNE